MTLTAQAKAIVPPAAAAEALLGEAVQRLRHGDDGTLRKVGQLEARLRSIQALDHEQEAHALSVELQLDIAAAFPASLGCIPVSEGEHLHLIFEAIGRHYLEGAPL